MKNICDKNECTACYSCINACPKQCITMHEDNYGSIYPVINEKICINCGLCYKTCPNNSKPEMFLPSACYASWIEDDEKRKKCASGGIGTAISEHAIIKNHATVYGSRFQKDYQATAYGTSEIEELEQYLRGKHR